MALITNLISYYKLDESSGNASDSVGGNTLTNGAVTYAATKINNGAVFVGTSSANLQGAVKLIPKGAKSVSFWHKTSSTANCGIIKNGAVFDATKNGFCVAGGTWNGNKLYFQVRQSGEILSLSTSMAVNNNTLRFITFTWDGTTGANAVKVYVNGALDAQATASGAESNDPSNNFILGYDSSAGYFTGSLDEVGVWSRALTEQEVLQLYQLGNGIQYPFYRANIKSYNTNLKANIKSINTNLIANVKSLDTNS